MGLLGLVLAAVLLGSAAAKLAAGERGRRALASYGLARARSEPPGRGQSGSRARSASRSLRACPARRRPQPFCSGSSRSCSLVAIAGGRAGQPCGCFGSRSRIGWGAAIRSACLAAAFLVLPFLPGHLASTEAWLGAGMGFALVGLAALAVALLALAREVGELRLAVAPQAALSLDHEGPELGGRVGLIERFERRAALAVAVFTSAGCSLCAALEPSLRLLAREPELELRPLRRRDDAEAWESLAVPAARCGRARAGRRGAQQGHLQLPLPAGIVARPGGSACLAKRSRARPRGAVSWPARDKLLLGRDERRLRTGAHSRAEGRGLPLLRPHLHDRLLPAPDRAATDRRERLPAARRRRRAGGRPRAAGGQARPAGRRARHAAARPRREPAAGRAAHTHLRQDRARVRVPRPGRRRLVSLLQRPHPQARRLLRLHEVPDQRRLRADGLLLQRPERVLVMYYDTKIKC